MYEQAVSFDELYKGLTKSCKNVRWKDSIVTYEANNLRNTLKLKDSLTNKSYTIDPYQLFTVYEPKKRDIVATRLKDRQFQRSLCDNGFYDYMVRSFIHDNAACQRGKGVDFALNRLTAHLRRYYAQNGLDGWFLKCDIKHYFQSISHEVAKKAVEKRVPEPEMVGAAYQIIDSFSGDCGIGLGSQVSQLVALAVLDDLDHFIKEELRIKYYLRYMDDFVLIHPNKEYLKWCQAQIVQKIEQLGLELNSKKTGIQPLKNGILMLQWHFFISPSGAIVKKMNKKKISSEKQKIRKIFDKECRGVCQRGTAKESLTAWLANAQRGNTFFQQQKVISYYKEMEEKMLDLYSRVAKLEAIVAAQKENFDDVLWGQYKIACELHNEEDAAMLARKIRNKKLFESDKEMTIDRLSAANDSATMSALDLLERNPWTQYRQELRDLPEQLGFPFDVTFPESPDAPKEEPFAVEK